MKKVIFALLAMLMLASSVFSQSLSTLLDLMILNQVISGSPSDEETQKIKIKNLQRIHGELITKRFKKANEKGEYETTKEFRDAQTQSRFKQTAIETTNDIIEYVKKESYFELGNYNADKGVYSVTGKIRESNSSFPFGIPIVGEAKISIEDAKKIGKLKESYNWRVENFYFKISSADIFIYNKVLFPGKVTLIDLTDSAKKYVFNFQRPQGAKDIIFRGSELWSDNPNAKNFVFNYKDLIDEVELAKQKAEQAEQIEKARLDSLWSLYSCYQGQMLHLDSNGVVVRKFDFTPSDMPYNNFEFYDKKSLGNIFLIRYKNVKVWLTCAQLEEANKREEQARQDSIRVERERQAEQERIAKQLIEKEKWKRRVLAVTKPTKLIISSPIYDNNGYTSKINIIKKFEIGEKVQYWQDLEKANQKSNGSFEIIYRKQGESGKVKKIIINPEKLDNGFGYFDIE